MKVLVPVERVVDFNVKIRVKGDGSGVELANVKMCDEPIRRDRGRGSDPAERGRQGDGNRGCLHRPEPVRGNRSAPRSPWAPIAASW